MHCFLFLLIYLVNVTVTVVVAAHRLLWICGVCLLCTWHHYPLRHLHPTSSIVDEFKSYYRFYNNNAKHVFVGFRVCAFYTEYKIMASKQT